MVVLWRRCSVSDREEGADRSRGEKGIYTRVLVCERERVWRPTRAGGGARAEMLGSFCVRGGREEEKRENRGAGEDEVGRRAAREA